MSKTTPSDSGATSIRPFQIEFPESAIADLRQRLAVTRLPDQETVSDFSQGVPLKTIKQILQHWRAKHEGVDRSDAASWLHQVCRHRGRLGRGHHRPDRN